MTYAAAAYAVASVALPPFWLYTKLSRKYRRSLHQRLGFVPPASKARLGQGPRVWIHAVSLGEIQVAFSVSRALEELVPGCSILISTTTEHGFDLALKTFDSDIPVIYAPVDLPFSARRALTRIRPHVLVFVETEIWPAWIAEGNAQGVRIALVNGRISRRSFETYSRFKFFFRHVLSGVHAFSMIATEDARRILAMGAEESRIEVNGNAKYDFLLERVDQESEPAMRSELNLPEDTPVLVAGSTRTGEEVLILEAYERIRKAFPGTVLIIAPRHIERARTIAHLVSSRGIECRLRSELKATGERRRSPVLILDTFGELFRVYSVATIVYCGASLVPLGGQNPLEPAAWGKPVLYGPSMEDFLDAKTILEQGGAEGTVTGPGMLADKVLHLLRNPLEREAWGERARQALAATRRAAGRHARVVAALLSQAGPPSRDDS
jgi:3-deoxy-D-manno-octulosonic-acid transferase